MKRILLLLLLLFPLHKVPVPFIQSVQVSTVYTEVFAQPLIVNGFRYASSYDLDAQAYFNAVISGGVTVTDQQKTDLSNFFVGLKSDGIYTAIKAMGFWPWANANGNKWNMVNPQNTDAAYRATFSGSPTHSSNGITFNGSSQFSDIKIKPNALSQNSLTIGAYVQTATNTSSVIIGCRNASNVSVSLWVAGNTTTVFYGINRSGITSGAVSGVTGFMVGSRTSSSLTTIYRNGSSQFTSTTGSAAPPAFNVYVGAYDDGFTGSENSYFAGRISFYIVADGLNSTQIANLNTRVEALHDAFGIGVQ